MIGITPRFVRHAVLTVAALSIAGAAHAVPVAGPTERAQAVAAEVRALEESCAWAGAAAKLRTLRVLVPPDADLELWLAVFEARSGALDSARIRLAGPLLNAAAGDTLPEMRWIVYGWKKSAAWMDGRWTGWHWYLWRARAEVAAAEARWPDALAAIRRTIAARPTDGKEWYARALCEAQLGQDANARASLARASALDPSLPEVPYLSGLLLWREGKRAEAQAMFRAAIEMASGYREPAAALLRVRMSGSPPDALPREFLSGVRRAGLLTSAEGPKREAYMKTEVPATLVSRENATAAAGGRKIPVQLLIDREGRVALSELPFLKGESAATIGPVLATLPRWRYTPAIVNSITSPAWVATELEIPR
jgi:tetratricopeptide (TPR) repeat protein